MCRLFNKVLIKFCKCKHIKVLLFIRGVYKIYSRRNRKELMFHFPNHISPSSLGENPEKKAYATSCNSFSFEFPVN